MKVLWSVLGGLVILGIIFVNSYAQSQLFTEETKAEPKSSEKISPKLSQWQQATNPQAFARDNDIQFYDGKIRVYIYLINSESISNLPNDIDVVTSSDQIVVANVNSQQITNLAQLDFVHRIDLPVTGSIDPPEPNTINPEFVETNSADDAFYYLIIPVVLIIGAIIVFKKRSKHKVKF